MVPPPDPLLMPSASFAKVKRAPGRTFCPAHFQPVNLARKIKKADNAAFLFVLPPDWEQVIAKHFSPESCSKNIRAYMIRTFATTAPLPPAVPCSAARKSSRKRPRDETFLPPNSRSRIQSRREVGGASLLSGPLGQASGSAASPPTVPTSLPLSSLFFVNVVVPRNLPPMVRLKNVTWGPLWSSLPVGSLLLSFWPALRLPLEAGRPSLLLGIPPLPSLLPARGHPALVSLSVPDPGPLLAGALSLSSIFNLRCGVALSITPGRQFRRASDEDPQHAIFQSTSRNRRVSTGFPSPPQ